jgi:hypothetical protein
MPPTISSGVISQGAKAESSSAAGSRIRNLLRIEPTAMRQMIGNSRDASNPTT